MKLRINTEPLAAWFGYTRRERRASFILLLVIFFIIAVRNLIPGSSIEPLEEEFLPGDTIRTVTDSPAKADTAISRRPARVFVGRSFQRSRKQILDLNRCDSAELVSLPGIGPVLAVRILKYRSLLGGFADAGQLKEVYGLPGETFDLIKGMVFADTSGIRRVDLNSAGFRELSRIIYFEKYDISAILKYRELRGRVSGIAELTANGILTEEKARKAGPYLIFR